MSDPQNSDDVKSQVNNRAISKSGLLKLAIPLIFAASALVIYNFYSVGAYQKMSKDIRDSMFTDQTIKAVLLTYRNNDNIKELTINVTGVSGELAGYTGTIIDFVCNSEFLVKELAAKHTVQVKLIAKLRKEDKYLDVMVKPEQCSGP